MNAITIIIPVYNTEKYLERCIHSVINQTFDDLEVIIINDGSTDNSPDIMSEYANKDKRIKIINQANKGLSAARNIGIKSASGEYILHVDSDDWIEPDMCKMMYNEAKNNNAGIVTSHVFFEYPNKTVIKHEPYKKVSNFNEFLMDFTTKRGINSVCNKLIKRNIYLLNNIEHYEDISLGEDSSTLLRLIVFANNIVTVNKAFYHYDIKETSMTGNKNKKVMEYIKGLSRVEDFYINNNLETDIFPLLRLKIAYLTMYGNMSRNTEDYKKLKKCCFDEIVTIKKHKYYGRLCIKYKLFVFACLFIKRVFNLREY